MKIKIKIIKENEIIIEKTKYEYLLAIRENYTKCKDKLKAENEKLKSSIRTYKGNATKAKNEINDLKENLQDAYSEISALNAFISKRNKNGGGRHENSGKQ